MPGFRMDDYVDVAERIRQFYERFPDGRLTTGAPPQLVMVDGRPFIWYNAKAYRSPEDPLPGSGWAAEPVPGPTQFTRDSELMNAETAAWGRAIVACGFETKKIASSQEVQGRRGNDEPDIVRNPQTDAPKTFPALVKAFERLLVPVEWLSEATTVMFDGRPREALTQAEKALLLQRLQTVYLHILEEAGHLNVEVNELGEPTRKAVQAAFATVLDGQILEGPPDPVVPKPEWLKTDPEAEALPL